MYSLSKFISRHRGGLSVTSRVRLLITVLVIFPSTGALILLETNPEKMSLYLAGLMVSGVILMVPLSSLISYLLVLKDMKEVEKFCNIVKSGSCDTRFELPPEQDKEHEFMVLKRNLNWMAHAIAIREASLKKELATTSREKDRFMSYSMLDPLTGLFNRRGFETRLEEIIGDRRFARKPITLMFLDADKFKEVNDTFGHQAGDELLCRLGKILQQNSRSQDDIPFRFGGDEFGVLFVGLAAQQAFDIAVRIIHAYNEVRMGDTTLSIGIAEYVRSKEGFRKDSARFINQADSAAYQAKNQGGDRVVMAGQTVE